VEIYLEIYLNMIRTVKGHLGHLSSLVLPIPVPEVIQGEGSSKKLAQVCKNLKITKVFIVTDAIIRKLGLLEVALKSLDEGNIPYVIFDKVLPDPDLATCDSGFALYKSSNCDGIVCIGGGSVMDCAKMIGVKNTNPTKDTKEFMMTLPLFPFYYLPPLIAIPTTAGTGSETTIAAVISIPQENRKLNIIDPRICPLVAIMDPKLLIGLPKPITAATGMDALTHAIESYLSPWQTNFTGEASLRSVEGIFRYLQRCYNHGNDLEARNGMLLASFDAGVAFTRANVGYVHAFSHQMGALFHTPHGEANAILLPHVLDFYLGHPACEVKLTELSKVALVYNPTKKNSENALAFVNAVKELALNTGIPKFIRSFPAASIDIVATRALNEANGKNFEFLSNPLKYLTDLGYPSLKEMNLADAVVLLQRVVDPEAKPHAKL
jgi:alcohol dehydrogenase